MSEAAIISKTTTIADWPVHNPARRRLRTALNRRPGARGALALVYPVENIAVDVDLSDWTDDLPCHSIRHIDEPRLSNRGVPGYRPKGWGWGLAVLGQLEPRA